MSVPSVRAWTALFIAAGAACLCVTFGVTQIVASASTSARVKGSNSAGVSLKADEVDVTGPEGLTIGNLVGIYKTTDAGRHWTNITPPLVASQPVLLSHLVNIVSVGSERIWLQCDGDSRFDFIPYSWNGGTTWSTSTLPSEYDNPSALQFHSSKDGWIIANVGTSSHQVTLRTKDGGATWIPAGNLKAPKQPVAGQPTFKIKQSVPKGLTIFRVYRVSHKLNWAQASGPGGTYLLRSTDGESVWETVTAT
jgi:photosystem II stability/assembly factor-like uncharacterized protein